MLFQYVLYPKYFMKKVLEQNGPKALLKTSLLQVINYIYLENIPCLLCLGQPYFCHMVL